MAVRKLGRLTTDHGKTGEWGSSDLEAKALSYLERFDTSAGHLRSVLRRHVLRALGPKHRGALPEEVSRLIEELVSRYQSSGILSDQRYAASIARTLRERGLPRRGILVRLEARGVDREQAEAALKSVDADSGQDAELEAAKRLVRRRRLGPYRKPAERSGWRSRDLSVLGRAGFSLAVAEAALRDELDTEQS